MKYILNTPLIIAFVITLVGPSAYLSQASAKTGIGPSFKGPVGLQLYSLRADFGKEVAGPLETVHKFGIENAELAGTYNLTPEEFKKQLQANHIRAVSGHFPYERFRDDVALGAGQMDLPAILAAAKRAGVKWYFIEDESSRATAQIPQSLRYLEQVKW